MSAVQNYKNLAEKEMPKKEFNDFLRKSDSSEEEKIYAQFEKMYLNKELNIICKLLDKGYSLKEVIEACRKHSLVSKYFSNKNFLVRYLDKVLKLVNAERIFHNGKRYEEAKKLYLQKVSNIINKYADYSKATYNAFHEGSVVISMMLQHHFSSEVIKEVLEKNSFYAQVNPRYIQETMNKCLKVKRAYEDIEKVVTPKAVSSEEDAYRFFAHEYMKKTHTVILSGRDEERIIAQMSAHKFPKQYITAALMKASPVAIEPGRNQEAYISSVMEVVNDNKKSFVNEQYSVTMALYNEKFEYLFKKSKNLDINKNRKFYDTLIARDLLEKQQSFSNIVRVISEKSVQSQDSESYAKWIVESAQKVLRAEKNLMVQDKYIPTNVSYKKLKESGITAFDLFKQAIHERIKVYPSFSNALTKPFVDKEICEKLLTRYPDFNKEELYDVICKHSPYALMPDISEEYPRTVIEEVEDRLKVAKKKEDYTRTVQEEYNKQCGLASEGVNIDSNMSLYQDGRAALRMMLKNINPMDIRNAIFEAAKAAAIATPLAYADEIVYMVENVYDRIEAIKDYKTAEIQTVEEDYKSRLSGLYCEKGFLQSSMDVEIMKNMLLESKFSIHDIRKAIKENSPLAIEPGRDEFQYGRFVEVQARERIAQEEIKLQNYKPVPRFECEIDAKQEYLYHQKQIKNVIDLPYSMQMDVLIAETMLMQGYKKDMIAAAMLSSPCVSQNINYGRTVLRNVENAISKQKEQSYVRSITKITEE